MRVVTVPSASKVVIISHEAKDATAPVPSLSLDIPTPTPITNSSAILSINAAPAFTKKNLYVAVPVYSRFCFVIYFGIMQNYGLFCVAEFEMFKNVFHIITSLQILKNLTKPLIILLLNLKKA